MPWTKQRNSFNLFISRSSLPLDQALQDTGSALPMLNRVLSTRCEASPGTSQHLILFELVQRIKTWGPVLPGKII